MTPLLVGLLICVGVAVVVIVVVALPHLREGAPLLATGSRPQPPGWDQPPPARQPPVRQPVEPAADAATYVVAEGQVVEQAESGIEPDEGVGEPAPEAGAQPVGPPRQVASPAATPAPGTSLGGEPNPVGERVRVDQPR